MNYHATEIEERNGCTIITLERVNMTQQRKRRKTYPRIFAVIAAVCVFGVSLVFTLAGEKNSAEAQETSVTGQVTTIHNLADEHSAEKPAIIPAVEWLCDEVYEVDEPAVPTSIGWFVVTAYCACEECCGKTPDDPWYGITATGTKATQGRTIAVDPRVIPYGTVLYFEGPDGCISGYVAEDCGGSIKGNRIDLYFVSHEEADEWGVRTLEVYAMPEEAA